MTVSNILEMPLPQSIIDPSLHRPSEIVKADPLLEDRIELGAFPLVVPFIRRLANRRAVGGVARHEPDLYRLACIPLGIAPLGDEPDWFRDIVGRIYQGLKRVISRVPTFNEADARGIYDAILSQTPVADAPAVKRILASCGALWLFAQGKADRDLLRPMNKPATAEAGFEQKGDDLWVKQQPDDRWEICFCNEWFLLNGIQANLLLEAWKTDCEQRTKRTLQEMEIPVAPASSVDETLTEIHDRNTVASIVPDFIEQKDQPASGQERLTKDAIQQRLVTMEIRLAALEQRDRERERIAEDQQQDILKLRELLLTQREVTPEQTEDRHTVVSGAEATTNRQDIKDAGPARVLTPEQEQVFRILDSIKGTDAAARKKAQDALAKLSGQRATKTLVKRLQAYLSSRKWGIQASNGQITAPGWLTDRGRPESGYMRLCYTNPTSRKTGTAETHAEFIQFVLVERPDRRSRNTSH